MQSREIDLKFLTELHEERYRVIPRHAEVLRKSRTHGMRQIHGETFWNAPAECGDHIGIRVIAAREECADRLCSFQASTLENGQSLAGQQAITLTENQHRPFDQGSKRLIETFRQLEH
jgi:hypothetical protein